MGLPTFPQRRSVRLKEYDYSQTGGYFITVCTYNRSCLFGTIVNWEMQLNQSGNIVAECWQSIPTHFEKTQIDEFAVMPNHIHGIVIIAAPEREPSGTAYRAAAPRAFGASISGTLSTIIGSFKSAVTRRIRASAPEAAMSIWQRNYYEHVIRGEKDLAEIREYIANNPARWAEDKYYSDTPGR